MAFQYDYVPEDKLNLSNSTHLLCPGPGQYKILSAEEYKSARGTLSLKVQLQVTDSQGARGLVYEYLTPKAAWKIKQILDSVGLPELYNRNGSLNERAMVGCQGDCILKTLQEANWPAKTVIEKFLPHPGDSVQALQTQATEELDDLPF